MALKWDRQHWLKKKMFILRTYLLIAGINVCGKNDILYAIVYMDYVWISRRLSHAKYLMQHSQNAQRPNANATLHTWGMDMVGLSPRIKGEDNVLTIWLDGLKPFLWAKKTNEGVADVFMENIVVRCGVPSILVNEWRRIHSSPVQEMALRSKNWPIPTSLKPMAKLNCLMGPLK